MLVHVKRDELLAIAAQTAKAAPKTATSEAVLGIHVEADSRRSMLTLTATNYEIVIRASMGASVEQSGSVVISAALFPAAIARDAFHLRYHHCACEAGKNNLTFRVGPVQAIAGELPAVGIHKTSVRVS